MSMRNHQPCLLNRIARALLCLVFIHALIGKRTNVAGPAAATAAPFECESEERRIKDWGVT